MKDNAYLVGKANIHFHQVAVLLLDVGLILSHQKALAKILDLSNKKEDSLGDGTSVPSNNLKQVIKKNISIYLI